MFIATLASVFLVEALIMFLLPDTPALSEVTKAFIDATLLTLIVSPLIYLFIYRSLLIENAELLQNKAFLKTAHQDSLRAIHSEYTWILECVGDMIYVADDAGNVIYLNAAARRHYQVDVPLGVLPLEFFFCGESIDLVSASFARTLESREQVLIEECMSGDRFFNVMLTPYVVANGRYKAVAVARDCTALHDSDRALRRTLAELEAVHATAPFLMMVVDRDKRVRRANSAAEQFTKRKHGDLIGRMLGDAFGCLQSLDDPQGCGAGPTCAACTLRLATLDTLTTGKAHEQIEAWLPFPASAEAEGRCLLVSTVRLKLDGDDHVLVSLMDITERKRAENALKLFRMLIDRTNDGIEVVDPATGRFLDVNEKSCLALGYSRDEYLSLSVWDIDPMIDRLGFLAVMDDVRNSGTATWVGVHRRKDGSTFPVEVTLKYVRHERDYLVAVARDITERERAEQQRKAYIRFLESLHQVDIAIKQETDVERMLSHILEAVVSIFNCDRAWLLYPCDPEAPSFRVPVEICRPEYPGAKALNVDIPMSPDMARNMREALESDNPVTYIAGTDAPINKVTAEQFGVQSQIFVSVFPKRGKPWAFGMHQCSNPRIWTDEEIQLFKEISHRISDGLSNVIFLRELQENERLYRSLIETTETGFVVISGKDGTVIDANQIYVELTGHRSLDELRGRSVVEWTAPYDRERNAEEVRKCFEAGRVRNLIIDYSHPDGKIIPVEINASVLETSQGRVIQTLCRDVSERKRAEDELGARQKQLVQSEKLAALGRMTAGVAHEMNQPLNAMRNYVKEILLNRREGIDMSPDEERENLENAVGQVDRMADIIRNMRLFVRENGEPDSAPILVKDLVDYPLSLLKAQLRAHDIRIEIQRGEPDLKVMGNLNRLQQVMINLVVNARDAIEHARLEAARGGNQQDLIALRWRRGDAKTAVIEVDDTGIGIPPEDASRIFEPFFTTKEREKGTGLGLAICHEIVSKHGGSIRFDSKAGRGSVFVIELPLAPGPDSEDGEMLDGHGI